MEDQSLSMADLWMRRYEQEHPEVLEPGYWKSQQDQSTTLVNDQQAKTPSLPSNKGGNACLWNGTERRTGAKTLIRSLEPVVLDAIDLRRSLKLTQTKFARCLGISPRTVSEWEQGRRCPSGAARTLLHLVVQRPDFLKELKRSL
ncbi:helix-turn-helix domain-containing protein [Neptuniibacter halophilus]|uniref:helix-turn-helix domain-containing protein n=1 Tax=Neptuniibacter halophilus TaxID=651666 RepID=UPI0025737F30|nr:helix-turn-helix domain-containing protein [Neptuniibacter halophilus]